MLTKDQIQFYKNNGYILLKNIFTAEEISECEQAYDELFDSKIAENCQLEATWGGDWKESFENQANRPMSVLSIHNLQLHSAIFTKFLLNSNLLDAVSEVVGSENILLHHTKAHIKPPGIGAPFPTHQDYPYFPFRDDSMVAVFIHLDDSDVENGGLGIFPGSHKLGPLPNASTQESHAYVDQAAFPLEKATPVSASKGDVLIFSYLLVHGSYPNVSSRSRRMLLFQMMAAEDEPLKLVHISPCHGMVLRGKNVKADGDLGNRRLH